MVTNSSSENALQERISTARIARFFLGLYALQLKAPSGAPSRYTLVDSQFSGLDAIYDLSVKIGDRFKSRRLTIGQLGTRHHSRSFCYKVVFDDPVVIKIPAKPIKTFQAYLKSLRSQRLIVDQYQAGNRIIAPGVTAFFKCTQLDDGSFTGSTARFESWGAQWLQAHPEYHRYLMISDSFVFLMDLSTYAFLSDSIYRIHDVSAGVPEEILRYPNVLWDFQGFENRYGRDRAAVYYQMNAIWSEYEKTARSLANQANIRPRTVYDQRQWLLARLARLSPEYPPDLPPTFITTLDLMLECLLEKNQPAVEDYRKTVKAYIREISFSMNKPKIRGLINGLLDMQAWLGRRRLAIRDLKPDNLFIAGDIEKNLHLTADPANHYLGLIDIETACGLDRDSGSSAQPLLGGTPSYATLSQFYPNSILGQVYSDLSLIFSLQDWYAVVVMIYEVMTGGQLFENTRKMIFDIKSWSNRARNKAISPVEAFCGGNHIFWRRITEEFDRNLRANKRRLKDIAIEPTEDANETIIRYAKQQLERTTQKIARLAAEQPGLLEDEQYGQLLNGSWDNIAVFRQELERSARVSTKPAEEEALLLDVVKSLEGQRMITECLRRGIDALEKEPGRISVYHLLKLMFYTVASAMETPRPLGKPAGMDRAGSGGGAAGAEVFPGHGK